MNKSSIFFAALAVSCTTAAFAQGADSNGNAMHANGSLSQPETTGTISSPSSNTSNSSTATTTSNGSSTKKMWKPHKTTGTDTSGTAAQPAGHDTGMAGSGPGVPANANGMGTTSH